MFIFYCVYFLGGIVGGHTMSHLGLYILFSSFDQSTQLYLALLLTYEIVSVQTFAP